MTTNKITAIRRDIGDLIAEYIGPNYDPVLGLALISQAPDWPKSLRLQAFKEVARYTRPLVTPEHGAGDRSTIVIVDQTREAADRGDAAALRALGHTVETSQGPEGDFRPVTPGDQVVIDPELTE